MREDRGQLQRFLRRLFHMPKKFLFFLALIPVILWVILFVNNLSFHIISIDPPLNNFPAIAPAIYISFNYPVNTKNIVFAFSPDIRNTYQVKGKQLIISFGSFPRVGQVYTLNLTSVTSTTGQKLDNTNLRFTVKDLPYSQLSNTLQQVIISGQDKNVPASRNTINLAGTDELINQGLSSFQLDAFKQAIFLFAQSKQQVISQAAVNQSTVQTFLPESGSTSNIFTMKFTMTIGQTAYNATILYQGATTLRLQLYGPNNGSLVYDSGPIDDSEL